MNEPAAGRIRVPSSDHGKTSDIGIGGASRLLPSHTTGHTGPYPAVRWIKHGRCFAPVPKGQTVEPVVSASVPSSNAVRASLFPVAPKARYLEFGRVADARSPHPTVLPAVRPSAKLV